LSRRSPVLLFFVCLLAYLALWFLTPRATFLPYMLNAIGAGAPFAEGWCAFWAQLAAFSIVTAPTIAFMLVQFGMVYYFSGWNWNIKRGLAALVLALVGAAALVALLVWQSGMVAKMHRYPKPAEIMYILANYPHPLKNVLVMLAASSIGILVSLRVRDRNLILPVVMAAACVDLWTVTMGPVATVLKRAPEVVSAVSTPIPAAGAGAIMPITMIGPGDFIFSALIFAAAQKLAMRPARNFWFIFASMTVGMLIVLGGIVEFLPALVMLAAGVVAANWGTFKMTRDEKISTAVVAAILIASLPLVWSTMRPRPEKEAKPAVKAGVAPSRAK